MNRLIHTRLGLALAIAFGIGIAELSNFFTQGNDFAAVETVAMAAGGPVSPMPATVGIENCAIPMLPLIVVRPDHHDLLGAETSELLAAVSGGSPVLSIPNFLPRVRLDMPYYSFGKLMPGATKE
ncbi:hypothetical protein [Dokdonella sp.]|uniref:hypothetical protein n=1 Tax=Dokdonella sp. TaxID=2291710 RepID=UPI003C640D5E